LYQLFLGTGPTTDHTLQSASGFYIYTEATGKKYKDKARIVSPMESSTKGSCLKFWYHMYGANMGTLSIFLKTSRGFGRPLWREVGNQGNAWRVASVTITSSQNFQVFVFIY